MQTQWVVIEHTTKPVVRLGWQSLTPGSDKLQDRVEKASWSAARRNLEYCTQGRTNTGWESRADIDVLPKGQQETPGSTKASGALSV